MGLGIRKPGYNIYVAGIQGTGKTSVIKAFLERWARTLPPPDDWVYVHDFSTPEVPRAVQLAPGDGRKLRRFMEQLIKSLRSDIPAALQSEEFENHVNAYLSTTNERKAKLYGELEKLAKSMDFQVKSSRVGIETIPIIDGRAMTEKDYNKLNEDQRRSVEAARAKIEPEVLDFARKIRAIENETKEHIETLRRELGESVVGHHIAEVREQFDKNEAIKRYLDEVAGHIIENLLDFVDDDDDHEPGSPPAHGPDTEDGYLPSERDRFRKYRVNLFVDHQNLEHAPVVIETNPTYYNLFGKIEKNVEHGMYLTDFTMIKCGSIHRASGGYLVLNALDIFRTPTIWETLKRVLKNRRGYIEDMGEQYSLLPTSGLRPDPIPLDVQVILIGNDEIYHALFDWDEDFNKIFKIKADFDAKMPRSKENIDSYVAFIATRHEREGLLPFDRSGVATIVEFGSRLVEDQRLLSTQFGALKDLTIEADFIAREQGARVVTRSHVEKAIDEKYYRVNLVEENILEMVRNEEYLIDVEGHRIGQVNGLAVYDLGDYSFGKIGRISCTTAVSDDGFMNIERASKLSGKIHDKGMYILTSYLKAILARKHSIGMSVSVCFEQSYGLIDGDSASVAELVGIVSALSGIPVDQSFAMTGSVNQFGEVQPVGGINEKIEGFFKAATLLRRDSKAFRIIIPHQNAANLVLHRDVRAAVRSGRLTIYPVKTVSEAFRLATGKDLGVDSIYADEARPGSAFDVIRKRLDAIHAAKAKGKHGVAPATATKNREASRPAAARVRRPAARRTLSGR